MKKMHVMIVALVAMFAISLVGAVSASAATLQWLAGTKKITVAAGLPAETTGSLILGETNGAGIK